VIEMNKNPLIGKIQYFRPENNKEYDVIEGFSKEDIKSAVEYWYEYRDEPMKFHDDFKNEFENFLIDELNYERYSESFVYLDDIFIEGDCKEDFNIWLFRHTFKDVIE